MDVRIPGIDRRCIDSQSASQSFSEINTTLPCLLAIRIDLCEDATSSIKLWRLIRALFAVSVITTLSDVRFIGLAPPIQSP
jgi:hypothetical protein